jgi:DNA-3-methyladenine glycosylase I
LIIVNNMIKRCEWPGENELMIKYHDEEWGMPVHDDRELFEFLVLETAQAGLSWQTILNRREGYRKAFAGFDFEKVAKFTEKDVERLMQDVGIIRNRLKIVSTITNAQNFIKIREDMGSFDKYIWGFVKNKPIKNGFKTLNQIPANTKISDEMSRDLKAKGFKFVGSTIMYAFMQAAGLVNDHVVGCYRYEEC